MKESVLECIKNLQGDTIEEVPVKGNLIKQEFRNTSTLARNTHGYAQGNDTSLGYTAPPLHKEDRFNMP